MDGGRTGARGERPQVPEGLLKAIHEGECVAFLGAGFTAAAGLPGWGALLLGAAEHPTVSGALRAHVRAKVAEGAAHGLDEAAQVLQDHLGHEAFVQAVRERLERDDLPPVMQRRLEMLRAIPFRAILTTNFDGVLEGGATGPEAYRAVLRPAASRWWEDRFWGEGGRGAQVVKLHGDLADPAGIVLTRRDYRRRLYGDRDYMSFLRAVLARYTVLYLGFSFVDAYLNELRSETLSLLGQDHGHAPVAYAILGDAPQPTCEHFLRNEGVHVLGYSTEGGTDHGGFDALLGAIREQADPVFRFGKLVAGKRLLWVDRQPANNAAVYRFLRRAAAIEPASETCEIVEAQDPGTALDLLRAAARRDEPFDLVVSHWGRGQARDPQDPHHPGGHTMSVARLLLRSMQREDMRAPVLFFSTRAGASQRKRAALRLGAQGYFFSYGGLLRGIEAVLSDGLETG